MVVVYLATGNAIHIRKGVNYEILKEGELNIINEEAQVFRTFARGKWEYVELIKEEDNK